MKRHSHIIYLLIMLAFVGSSCGQQVDLKGLLPAEQSQPTPTTSENFDQKSMQAEPQQLQAVPINHDTEPLRFTFPTPGPAPKFSLRPALYEVPWALGPYDHFYFSRPIAADEVNWPLADYRYGGIFFQL